MADRTDLRYGVCDGWGAYRVVAKAGYEHEPITTVIGPDGYAAM